MIMFNYCRVPLCFQEEAISSSRNYKQTALLWFAGDESFMQIIFCFLIEQIWTKMTYLPVNPFRFGGTSPDGGI